MKVIIAGTRTITNYALVSSFVTRLKLHPTEIVSGGATGVDAIGEEYAKLWDIKIVPFLPKWDLHGKAAGPIRNREMANYADVAVVVWDGKSVGTKNMIDEMVKLDKQVYIYIPDRSDLNDF